MRALILGGASSVWRDVAALESAMGEPWSGLVIATNDAGTVWSRDIDVWATLHAEKLPRWMAERHSKGLNMDFVTWGRPEKPGTDRRLAGWTSGSTGLFAVGVALALGCRRVVLAGVPMDAEAAHFFDPAPWEMADSHREVWRKRADLMRGRVWSLSGWTRRLLGPPPWTTEHKDAA